MYPTVLAGAMATLLLGIVPFEFATQPTPDAWWAEVPEAESDAITRRCRQSGTPTTFREVRREHLREAEARLRDQSIVPIDLQEALHLAGRPTENVQWKAPHLVRGLRVDSPAGVFTVDLCGDVLLVGYTADPGRFKGKRVIRAPLVVELDALPQRVFVTCGEGVR